MPEIPAQAIESIVYADSPYIIPLVKDLILANATDGAISVKTPSAVGRAGKKITVIKTDNSVNAVTLSNAHSQTYNGTATYVLSAQYSRVTLESNGANWTVVDASPILTATLNNGTITGTLTRTGYIFSIPACQGVAGAVAGFTVGGENASHARCAAGVTAGIFILPIPIHVGDIITGYKVNGQIESAGNGVTVDVDIYESTMVAGEITEASKSAGITQVTATADAVIAATKASLAITKATAKPLYFRITVTTGAATDVAIADIEVTITQK